MDTGKCRDASAIDDGGADDDQITETDRRRGVLQMICTLLPCERLAEARRLLAALLDPIVRERVERVDLGDEGAQLLARQPRERSADPLH